LNQAVERAELPRERVLAFLATAGAADLDELTTEDPFRLAGDWDRADGAARRTLSGEAGDELALLLAGPITEGPLGVAAAVLFGNVTVVGAAKREQVAAEDRGVFRFRRGAASGADGGSAGPMGVEEGKRLGFGEVHWFGIDDARCVESNWRPVLVLGFILGSHLLGDRVSCDRQCGLAC
jgi:hypothetical protein